MQRRDPPRLPATSGPLAAGALCLCAACAGPSDPRDEPVATATDPLVWSETQKLEAGDPNVDAWFGFSVAVEGDTAIIGADQAHGGGVMRGAVYVYDRDPQSQTWSFVTQLTGSQVEGGNYFGNAVALSGDVAVVGCTGGGAFFQAGEAYVFYRDRDGTDAWGEVARLEGSDLVSGDMFGGAVAVSGDVAIVGAKLKNEGALYAGAAYVFSRNQDGPDAWGQVTKLTASDPKGSDYFGGAVAIEGDLALIGAEGEESNGEYAGAVYVVERNLGGPDQWDERTKITASDAAADDWFGMSVGLSGDLALVGALGADSQGSAAGAAYLFDRTLGGPNGWGEVTKITASTPQADAQFGQRVALDGDLAVVGAPTEDSPSSQAGAAYVFQRHQGGANQWGEVGRLVASDGQSDDGFGGAVALTSSTVLVGARHHDSAGSDAGAAYVYQWLGSLGESCSVDLDCAGGFCADGVCCDSACGAGAGDDCVACDLSGSEGVCTALPDGSSCAGGTCESGACSGGAGGAGAAGGAGPGGSGGGEELLGSDYEQRGVDQGGCGCRTIPARSPGSMALWALLSGALLGRRRRNH